MKIASWNVNSLRARMAHVLAWLEAQRPDVLALQEIKMTDMEFPALEFDALGYQAICSGQPSYNGVALLTREDCGEVCTALPDFTDPQRRVLGAKVGPLYVLDLYVPNGQSVESDKYRYKLEWLAQLDLWIRELIIEQPNLVVLGDFNIAPDDRDVYDPAAWVGSVLASEPERAAFQSLLGHGLKDSFRLLNEGGGNFSWWDYRAAGFQRNLGLRIDHILLSRPLAERCSAAWIDREPRGWDKPSDHAPVVVELNLP
ncbi:MAG TPA: exodeoxyribonuclease III [Gammaproteobacteria bacterium]|nr:exodeoxyribonuclease III [Gammaproteobacteria bacterium]